MPEIVIQCPKCDRKLKLSDRSKLGKKARCPKCKNVFFMTAPPDDDEVEMELAEAPSQPVVGVGGQWVPDDAPTPGESPQVVAPQSVPQQAAATQPKFDPQAPVAAAPQPTGFVPQTAPQSGLELAAEDQGGAAHLKALRKKNAKRRNVAIVSGILTAFAVAGVVYAARDFVKDTKKELAEQEAPKRDEDTVAEKEELKATTAIANAASPTAGERLKLNGLPLGARVLVSVRPAELWAEGTQGQEFLFCLGPLGEWVTAKIKEFTNREPAEIEQIIFAVIPGEVGEPAETAAVFRYTEKQSKAKLILEFEAAANDDFGYKVYLNEDKAFALIDLQTVAVCPAGLASEMAESVQFANPQPEGVDALVHQSDSARHVNVIFEPRSIARHRDTLLPEITWPMADHFLRFFNDEEIETVLWSVHLGDQKFFSEILMRNQTIIREHLLVKEMRKKLKQLPYDVWKMVEKMNPERIGPRKVIGRFPAMTQLFAKATIGGIGMTEDGRPNRYAQLVTSLDERAAPNLAIGSLLTWDESTRTDFTIETKPRNVNPTQKLPDLIADRLKMKIEVEFNRMPLQEAFAFIAEECKAGVEIDGDALKDKGYTKNMPQSFAMTDSGLKVIKTILDKYESMCLVVEEDKKQFLITTESFAKQKNQTVYEFK